MAKNRIVRANKEFMSSDFSVEDSRAIREQAEQLRQELMRRWRITCQCGIEGRCTDTQTPIDRWCDPCFHNACYDALRHLGSAEGAERRQGEVDKLLAIAGLVNGYHNDGTVLSAAETLAAIARVLGPPMTAPSLEDR